MILSRCPDGGFDGLVDAALDADGVGATGDELETFAINRLGQDRGGGGTVAGGVAGLARDFADQTGSVTLNDATSPQFANYQGLTNNYGTFTFNVPSGRTTGWTPRSPTRPIRPTGTTRGSG